jgi:hypothetical protein
MSKVLVVAEQLAGKLNAATLSAITAATQIGGDISILGNIL